LPRGAAGHTATAKPSRSVSDRLARLNLGRLNKAAKLANQASHLFDRAIQTDVLGADEWEHVGARMKAADIINKEPRRTKSGQLVNWIIDAKLVTSASGRVNLPLGTRSRKILEARERPNTTVAYVVLHDGPAVPDRFKGLYVRIGVTEGFSVHSPSPHLFRIRSIRGLQDMADPQRRRQAREEILDRLDAIDQGKFQAESDEEKHSLAARLRELADELEDDTPAAGAKALGCGGTHCTSGECVSCSAGEATRGLHPADQVAGGNVPGSFEPL
jgi:hypothetical protein